MEKVSENKYSVLIIGCGKIAGGFDSNSDVDALPLTHASAYKQHGGFEIISCVDVDKIICKEFQERWGIKEAHQSLDDLNGKVGSYDVISICSPTSLHAEHLYKAIELQPRLIFCEKPMTSVYLQSEDLVCKCKDAGILLAINHTRRWAPDVIRLHNAIDSDEWGKIHSIIGFYNKGILNNGSHLIDLIHYLFGSMELISVGPSLWDYSDEDPSTTALLKLANSDVPVYLNISSAIDYSHFELQIITSEGVLTMEDSGMNWRLRRVTDSTKYEGYKSLDTGEHYAGEYVFAMKNSISNIYKSLQNNMNLASTGDTALQAQKLCEEIKVAALTDKKNTSESLP